MFTEITINTKVSSYGSIENKYLDKIKLQLDDACGVVDILPVLQDENEEDSVYISLNKEQCKILAAILKTMSDSL